MVTSESFEIPFFKERSFVRKQCRKCDSFFWTQSPEQELCQDQPCVEYSFIGNPLTRKQLECSAIRERFLQYFEEKGHKRIKPYPVVARWREDIYLNIASISDFQPHITSGEVPPPANPLVIAQPCIRLNDLELVGKTGRHLSMFEMLGHHAFNMPDKSVYWINETVQYCDDFFHKALGVTTGLTYKESSWAGGGNAGTCLEVLVGGLEVATLVFMNLIANPNGKYKVEGERYSPMRMRIVDTGYGLERIAWLSKGQPTLYDAAFPELIELIKKESGISFDLKDEHNFKLLGESAKLSSLMPQSDPLFWKSLVKRLRQAMIRTDVEKLKKTLRPIEDIYTLADHTRCLAFMLGDGLVPSNVKAGYLARLIIRRCYRLMQSLDLKTGLSELVVRQLDSLVEFPDLGKEREQITRILDLEVGKFDETLKKGTELVKRLINKGEDVSTEKLIELYDIRGIPPSMVKQVAEEMGGKVEIPPNFEAMVAEKHTKSLQPPKKEETELDLPLTKLLYYGNPLAKEFDGVVLFVEKQGTNKSRVVLDKTLFYSEGGGQLSDRGTIDTPEKSLNVYDVQKEGDIIIHEVEGRLKVGEVVHGRLDWGRRTSLMRNHSATHIINGAAQMVLGSHVWQAGSQLDINQARLDITHYKHLTPEEVREIEIIANRIIIENVPIEKLWMDRNEAEKKYGFRLYQGGVPKGRKLRVVRIPGYDVEACGGIHCEETADVGLIKILRTERIQDGVERIEFAAGFAALSYIQYQEKLLKESAKILSVKPEQLPKAVKRFFEEWKALRKKLDLFKTENARKKAGDLLAGAEHVGNARVVTDIGSKEMDELIKEAAEMISKPGIVTILGSKKGNAKLVIACSDDVNLDCREIIKGATQLIGGSGGGKANLAQGGGPPGKKVKEAVDQAKKLVIESLAQEDA
ncbi:MAG TPA: alanine--tRNA ligase [Thermoplasmata archaeon]|nr:alanine--tRNA ligase [Thermoplasmata archaeon]